MAKKTKTGKVEKTPQTRRQANPWKCVGTKRVYENPWIAVREDAVIRPSGTPGIYGVVEFKNIAMGVVALTDNDEVILVGQYRYPLHRYSWEIPEGGCPAHERPLAAAKRELEEETGFRARSWKKILDLDLSNSSTNETAVVYLATGLEQFEAMPEDTEVLQVKRVKLTKALQMVFSGEITDAISVAALLRVSLERPSGQKVKAQRRAK